MSEQQLPFSVAENLQGFNYHNILNYLNDIGASYENFDWKMWLPRAFWLNWSDPRTWYHRFSNPSIWLPIAFFPKELEHIRTLFDALGDHIESDTLNAIRNPSLLNESLAKQLEINAPS